MNRSEIGKRLVELRGDRSQAQVAQALEISTAAVGMYERGERIPRDEIKVKLARFYGVLVGDIFYPENDTDSVEKAAI